MKKALLNVLCLFAFCIPAKAQQSADAALASMLESAKKLWYANPDSSLFIASQALGIAKQAGDLRSEALAYNSLGVAERVKGNYPNSMEYHLKALRIREKSKDAEGLANSYNNIGNLYEEMGNMSKAMESHRASLENAVKAGYEAGMANSYNNMADVYFAAENLVEAYKNYHKALGLRIKNKINNKIPHSMHDIGKVHLARNDIDSAVFYFEKALAIWEKLQTDKIGLADSYLSLAKTSVKKNRPSEAISFAEKGQKAASEVGAKQILVETHDILHGLYAASGNFVKAYANLIAAQKANQEMFSIEKEKALKNLESQYEIEEHQKKIELITKDKQIEEKAAQAAQANNKLLLMGIGALLIIGAAILWGALSQKKTNAKLQDSQNKLKKNSEALKATNEYLEEAYRLNQEVLAQVNAQSEELFLSNTRLAASEEELKQNSEELKAINNHLEDSALELEKSVFALQKNEEALNEAKIAAEQANKAKTEFLANMSHEIRSPLNAISGFSQLLMQQAQDTRLPDSVLGYIENIRLSSSVLSEIINNILDLSKIEAGKLLLDVSEVDFKLLFKGIYHINKGQAATKGVSLHYEIAPEVPAAILSDRTKLNQALMNLVSNAIKFTPEGKNVRMSASLTPTKWLRIEVADEGIGIPKNRQEGIFLPFEQADNSTTRKFGGTGLGLAITKKISELLGGVLGVESEEGKGACFFLEIPFLAGKGEGQKLTVASAATLSPENKVLLVEDLKMNQMLMKAYFKNIGVRMEVAENGKEGLEMALAGVYDLILMDIHMPIMDGMEAVRLMRATEKLKNIPIVAASADAFNEQQNEAAEAGFSHYITKPIDFDKLGDILARYLKQREESAPLPVSASGISLEDRQNAISSLLKIKGMDIFQTEEIVAAIDGVRDKARGVSPELLTICDKMEEAAFSGDADGMETILGDLNKMSAG